MCVCVRWGGGAATHKIKHFLKHLPTCAYRVRGLLGTRLSSFQTRDINGWRILTGQSSLEDPHLYSELGVST